jgi:hypothetical protein
VVDARSIRTQPVTPMGEKTFRSRLVSVLFWPRFRVDRRLFACSCDVVSSVFIARFERASLLADRRRERCQASAIVEACDE